MILERFLKKLRKKSKRLYRTGWDNQGEIHVESIGTLGSFGSSSKDKRKEVKPKAVMKELLGEKAKIDLTNLDQKIKVIKKRAEFMEDEIEIGASDERKVLSWLNARKKYPRNATLFCWKTTTQTKIDTLLSKYQLALGSISFYKRCIPEEAIDEMEKFTKACRKVTNTHPEIKIIADKDETKKDPIVLGVSPFGNFFYVLGAWDKEVEIMDELYG